MHHPMELVYLEKHDFGPSRWDRMSPKGTTAARGIFVYYRFTQTSAMPRPALELPRTACIPPVKNGKPAIECYHIAKLSFMPSATIGVFV